MNAAIALFAFGLIAGCAGSVASQDVEGAVALGQVANVGGPRVRPDALVEDSRCPIDAQCVWAGRVVLRATVFGRGGSRQIDLILGAPVPVADGALTLVSVEPERTSARQAPPQRYRFTFAFEGGL